MNKSAVPLWRDQRRGNVVQRLGQVHCHIVILVSGSKYCYPLHMSTVRKVSIALPDEMVAIARQAVDGGKYASVSEVVREALRDWKDKQDRKAVALKELKRLVREGIDSGSGQFASMDEIKSEARKRLVARSLGA